MKARQDRPLPARVLHIGVLAAATAVVVYVGVRLSLAAENLSDSNCKPQPTSLPGWAILLVSVAMFGVGRAASTLRTETAPAPGPRRGGITGALAVKVALCLLFLFGVLALSYETVGVWPKHPDGIQPITYYVRCGVAAAPKTSLLAAGTISFFTGHWLWFRGRG